MLEGKQEAKNQTKNLDNFNYLGPCKINANGLNPLWIVKTLLHFKRALTDFI